MLSLCESLANWHQKREANQKFFELLYKFELSSSEYTIER